MRPRLGINSVLALVAFAAGALAILGDPTGGTTVTLDTRAQLPGDSQHSTSRIHTGDCSRLSNPECGLPGEDPGAARDVQDSISRLNISSIEYVRRPLHEQCRHVQGFICACPCDLIVEARLSHGHSAPLSV